MALQLTTTLRGYTAEYWKIADYEIDFINEQTRVILILYKDRATRTNNKFDFISQKEIRFKEILTDRKSIYEKLKEPINELNQATGQVEQVNPFVNSADVLE